MRKFASLVFIAVLFFLTSFHVENKRMIEDNRVIIPANSFGFVMAITESQDGNTSLSSASSVVIKRSKDYTRVLTAGHVCSVIEKGRTQFGIKSFVGRFYFVRAQVYSKNPDLCIMETDEAWGFPLEIASKRPEYGEKFWNMGSPYGVFESGLLLTFEGIYSGSPSDGSDWYTIPAAPGSSGSPILNENGEIVGIIHSAFLKLPHIAVSSNVNQIRAFVKTANSVLDSRLQDAQK